LDFLSVKQNYQAANGGGGPSPTLAVLLPFFVQGWVRLFHPLEREKAEQAEIGFVLYRPRASAIDTGTEDARTFMHV
jgi:hypothetical protein